MNYYNPYYSFVPYSTENLYHSIKPNIAQTFFGKLRGIHWSSLLDNTQRVLGIANQAIPIVKQATPLFRNAKTMFQIMNEFKKVDAPQIEQSQVSGHSTVKQVAQKETSIHSNGPTFFM